MLALKPELLDAALRHARDEAPRECCGILLGTSASGPVARVRELMPASNSTPEDPRRTYRIGPESILEAMRRGRDARLEIVGFYHSHPDGEAAPSQLDLETAWPRTRYLILAPAVSSRGARCWRLREGPRRLVEEGIEFLAP